MAFPVVETADAQSGTVTSNSSAWTLTYPTNLASGDLIVAMAGIDGAGAIGGSITGFNYWPTVNTGNPVSGMIAAKISDGTETGNFTFNLGANEQGGWRTLRVTGWYGSGLPASGTLDQVGTVLDGDGVALAASGGDAVSSANILSLNPGNWDVEDTLWVVTLGIDTSRVPSAWPSGWSPGDTTWDNISGGSNGATLSTQYRQSAAASIPSGSWTWTTNDEYVTLSMAVRPAAAAAPPPPRYGFVNYQDPGVL